MKKHRFLLFVGALCYFFAVSAQSIYTLEECYQNAQQHYPLVQQFGLLEQARKFNMENAGKGYLPQMTLSARASHQSDVTGLPVAMPGVETMSKSQYQVVLEVSQNLWDGGMIASRKKSIEASSEIEVVKTEVDLYALKQRVNQLFFGILLLDEYLVQNELLQDVLKVQRERIEAFQAGGMANQSDVDVIAVEQVKARQKKAELIHTRSAYRSMLSVLTGLEIGEEDQLVKPSSGKLRPSVSPTNRPEIQWFDARARYYSTQEHLVLAASRPKISLFLQGGAGNPGLNMLENNFSPFYVAGARLSWSLGGLYTKHRDLLNLQINRDLVDVQKQTFEFNTRLEATQQASEIRKLVTQIKSDEEIVVLRRNIREAAEAKVEHGIISVSDLIRDLNAEHLAIQDRTLHEMQLLMAEYQLQFIVNH